MLNKTHDFKGDSCPVAHVMLPEIVRQVREKLNNNISDEALFKLLDTDYEDIELDILGHSAMKLVVNPELNYAT